MKKTTREWVRKAENDYRAAAALARESEPLHDEVCFHSQQAAEKFLKALLEELGHSIPKTHDLDKLLTLMRPHFPVLRSFRRGLIFLTDFAVDTRYPGNWTKRRQARAALRWAGRVRDACRSILGIRAVGRRKTP